MFASSRRERNGFSRRASTRQPERCSGNSVLDLQAFGLADAHRDHPAAVAQLPHHIHRQLVHQPAIHEQVTVLRDRGQDAGK